MNWKIAGILAVLVLTGVVAVALLLPRQPESAPSAKPPVAPPATSQPKRETPPEPATATPKVCRSPVPRPAVLPKAIQTALSEDKSITAKQRGEGLAELADRPKDEAMLEALRWYIHQGEQNPTLRNEAVKVLLTWHASFLVEDCLAMTRDEAQPESWRAWCPQYLEEHYRKHQDTPALDGLKATAGNNCAAVQAQAVFCAVRLARDFKWTADSHPETYTWLKARLEEGLKSSEPRLQENAAVGIGELGLKEYAPQLEELAGNEKASLTVRVSAVRALIQIGRPESLPPLERLSQGSSPALAQVAKLAIQAIKKRNP